MTRLTTLAASFCLALGLGLGVTGIASAVGSPGPTPSAGTEKQEPHDRAGHPGQGLRGPHGPRSKGKHPTGLVTAVMATSLTVATPSGAKTIGRDAKTTYALGSDAQSAGVLAVGKVVVIRLVDPRAAKPVAERITVLPARIAGVVTAVEGSTLTVVDRDGFTRTIHVSSTPTTTVGEYVVAVGTVASDGTTLDATEVRTGPGTVKKHW